MNSNRNTHRRYGGWTGHGEGGGGGMLWVPQPGTCLGLALCPCVLLFGVSARSGQTFGGREQHLEGWSLAPL